MRIDIITIFPEYFRPLEVSLLGKAAERGIVEFGVHDLRAWAHDTHRTVDDTPFGGGPGMVMTPGPWGEALDAVTGGPAGGARLVVPTPAGVPFRQEMAAAYARCAHLVFACGRYEGIDARVIDEARTRMAVDEVSVGDYVLSGGEPAALVMIDAVGAAAARCARQRRVRGGRLLRGRCRARWPACWKARSSPGHGSGGAGKCLTSCCRGITPRSRAGGGTRRCGGRREPARSGGQDRSWLPRRAGPAGAV